MKFQTNEFPLSFYRVVLIAAAAIWGLGFLIGKNVIAEIGASWYSAIRFLGSGIILLIVLFPNFKKHFNKDILKAGCIIGFFSFLGFWTQFVGLGLTTPSKNAFLSACYCLTVPLIWWVVARKRPTNRILIAAVICTVGVGLVSLTESLSMSIGDAISILSAFLYGAEIVAISINMKDHDIFTITTIQQFTCGILALICALITEPTPTIAQLSEPSIFGALAYLVLLSAVYGALAQNLAQSKLSAAESGLLCSTESVFCALFSVLILGEVFTSQMLVGFVLIFCSIVMVQLEPTKSQS